MSKIHRVIGALKSRKKAAYLGLVLYALAPITRILDKLLGSLIKDSDNSNLLILITCPPRSGSTVFFQYLTRDLKALYPSNLHFLFPKMASRFFDPTKIESFQWKSFNNYYGYTPHLHDVNEGNYFFNALFNLDEKTTATKLKTFLNNFNNPRVPIICKSVSSFQNLSTIFKAYPKVLFVTIQRDFSQNIQSELAAYYELKSFNPIPDKLSSTSYHTNPASFATQQILEIQSIIKDQLKNIPEINQVNIEYEKFCQSPHEEIERLLVKANKLNSWSIERRNYTTKLKASSRKKVSDEDLKVIEEEISKHG